MLVYVVSLSCIYLKVTVAPRILVRVGTKSWCPLLNFVYIGGTGRGLDNGANSVSWPIYSAWLNRYDWIRTPGQYTYNIQITNDFGVYLDIRENRRCSNNLRISGRWKRIAIVLLLLLLLRTQIWLDRRNSTRTTRRRYFDTRETVSYP